MNPAPETAREQTLQSMAAEPLEALIIGGGIVGAGVARDAAMRGLRIGLLEQHDFAFGASSRTSRLLHGGLRYLAQGRVGLVREASREKAILRRIAPHLVQPMRFVFPAYRKLTLPLWQLAVGVKLYDRLSGGGQFGRSCAWNAQAALERMPGLRPEGLAGAVCYYDALTNDARLAIDTLCSAAAHGALLCNYARVERAEQSGGLWLIDARDAWQGRSFQVRSRCVVNATGAWGEQFPHSRLKLRPTKGAHLIVERERMPVQDAAVLTEGRRILFVIPWARRVILGTTDTDCRGSPDEVHADQEDVRYILGAINAFFPKANLQPQDVRSSWAGLRPLIADRHGRPSDISRTHKIHASPSGWIDVAGGKLTTYRLMAQQTVDLIVRRLGRRAPPCRTADEPLIDAEESQGLSAVIPPLATELAVRHCCEHEWALHLDDIMVRRAGWRHWLDDPESTAGQVAGWMAEILNWDAARKNAEIDRYRQAASRDPSARPAGPSIWRSPAGCYTSRHK